MKESVSEKDLLIMMLNAMSDQLEELDFILETSFSDFRSHLFHEETKKLIACRRKVSLLENHSNESNGLKKGEFTCYSLDNQQQSGLKLEWGFHSYL